MNPSSIKTLAVAAALSFASWSGPASSVPIVVGLMEGYSLWQGQENTIGINSLNSAIRNRLVGENYYSRVFDWDQVDEAANYFRLFNSSTNYLIGYSRGGYQALRVANELSGEDISIDRLVQLDPVRCGGTGAYASDNVGDCRLSNPFRPISSIFSSGPQIVPDNVVSATNYFQTGGGITGEREVTGANNVNVNDLFGDTTINHSTIDDDLRLRQQVVNDIFGLKDDNVLMTGLGGVSGFGTLAMTSNDDGSTNAIQLPFDVNFNGTTYNTIYINNNGNITFGGPFGAYTPTGFTGLPVQMIAPYWGDVDTRCATCGAVYVAVPTSDVAVITWDGVGFFPSDSSKTNTFQLILRDRNDLEGSNTDVEFRYGDLQWTTGGASGGSNGLGGQPAFAGYTGGALSAPQTLIGSGTSSVLTLDERSNIEKPGHWYFPFREGSAPGVTRDNPLLPDVDEDGWHFQYTTTRVEEVVWSDPRVVYGYDFETENDINFRSFILPVLGDNLYQLWLGDPSNPTYIADIIGGSEYFFSDLGFDSGIDFFRILGVDLDLSVDPNDVTAFVTGLTFVEPGLVQWVQRPLSTDTNVAVNEPPTMLLLLIGVLAAMSRKRLWH
ncbi:nidogen-like domain-containing protein [Nitrosospira multiformis]|uniref:PEP-CTERM protein-sorting domain-containing protein n=1 Tax=Nitrosospira multiformis TaxID=1231 RepID=A0A1I7FTU1_9PROT|nr:nidogen-like domain-containing protein [Nitrosospira multiformis]SFU39426.1 PEP-CTERM protein-sorting domain-containing protein [Nitrosospira multiformis]